MSSKQSNNSSTQSQYVPHYRQGNIRFLQLFLLILILLGNMYAFNNPQALQQALENDLQINQFEFNMLYTIDALPNIFLASVIGFLIDYFGVRICIILICIFGTFFQLIIAIGGFTYSYYTILVGRCLFGVSLQSIITAQTYMIAMWFQGKQLALALGIGITFPQLGNALNSVLSPLIYSRFNSLGLPLLLSVIICMLSTGCAVGSVLLDIYAQKVDRQNMVHFLQDIQQDQSGSSNSNHHSRPNTDNQLNRLNQNDEIESQTIQCSDITKLKKSFFLIVIICMFGITQYVPFMDNANSLFIKRFCLTPVQAGKFITITYLVGAFVSVPLGILVDKVGYRRYFIMSGMAIFTTAQIIILAWPTCFNDFQQIGPVIISLFLIGVGYCFYANCMVAAIPLVVKNKFLGTAFGIMGMAQSFSQAFIPFISGAIISSQQDDATGYRFSSLFFTLLGILGLIISFGLFFVSQSVKKKLDSHSKRRKAIRKNQLLQIQIAGPTPSLKKQLSGQVSQQQQNNINSNINLQKQIISITSQQQSLKQRLIPIKERFAYDEQNSD